MSTVSPAPPHARPRHPAAESHADRARRTRRLLERYHHGGDARARHELIARFYPLARQLARRYARGREPLDDLVQVACVGLVKAVDRFDPERGTSFSSYAVPMMLGELRRHFRDTGWAVHVPRGLQECVLRVEQATRELSAASRRSPTTGELAQATGATIEEVTEALQASRATETLSLDAPRGGEDGETDTRWEAVGHDDDGFELVEYRSAIAGTVGALPERDRLVLHMRFVEDLTQTEIAARVGVSQMQVSRLLRRSLDRLRTVAGAS